MHYTVHEHTMYPQHNSNHSNICVQNCIQCGLLKFVKTALVKYTPLLSLNTIITPQFRAVFAICIEVINRLKTPCYLHDDQTRLLRLPVRHILRYEKTMTEVIVFSWWT